MASTIFIIALVAYLSFATVNLFRNPVSGWGFPMFVLLFPIFLVALFFIPTPFVVGTWFSLALANMLVQFVFMKRAGVQTGLTSIMAGSLFLWPLQFAAAINSSQTEKDERKNKEDNRGKIGTLPATITGTVSYTHHHGTDQGHDSVWLEEYGDLDFMTDSKTYDRIGIAEGKVVSLTIDEREAPDGMAEGKVLWIADGSVDVSA